MKAKIVGVKVWMARKYWYTREENLEFGGLVEARFDEHPTDDEFDKTVDSLYSKMKARIKAEVKAETAKNKLFRLAKKVERPKLIRGFERMLKRKGEDESD